MINFNDSVWTTRTRFSGNSSNMLYSIDDKIIAWKKQFEYRTSRIENILINSIKSANESDKPKLVSLLDKFRTDARADYILTGDRKIELSQETLNSNNIEDILKVQKALKHNESLAPPQFTGKTPLNGREVELNGKFNKHFQEYYTQAKQLNNFNCSFLPTFRSLNTLMENVPSGKLLGYFDIKVQDFLEYLDNFVDYLNDSPNDKKIRAFNLTYNNTPSYNSARLKFNREMLTGQDQMNALTTTVDQFLDSLQIGLKIISTVNIVMTCDPQDNSMFMSQSQTNMTIYPPASALPHDKWLMIRELQASAYATQTTLALKPRLKPDFTNFELLASNAINITLNQFGITAIMQNLATAVQNQ